MKKTLCASCNKRKALIHPIYGRTWCKKCRKKCSMPTSSYPEMVPDSLKEDRKKYFNSIVQPYRDGKLSKEYIEVHGTKNIKATPEEIKKAKYVWKDLKGFRTKHKSL